jgi:K+-sensing histidine kinase KdpD
VDALRKKNMKVKNAARWAPRGRRRWLVAGGGLIVAIGARSLAHPLFGPIMPGTAFFIVAALVEYYFGLGPALIVMVLGLGFADYLFVPPYGQFDVLDQSDLALICSYPLATLLVICLIERLRRAQFRAELIADVARSRYEMLLRVDNERAVATRAADETHRLLRHLPHYHSEIVMIKAVDRNVSKKVSDLGRTQTSNFAIAPGVRMNSVHGDDIKHLSSTVQLGNHRVRVTVGHAYKTVNCLCERFSTHAGDFLVFRLEESL